MIRTLSPTWYSREPPYCDMRGERAGFRVKLCGERAGFRVKLCSERCGLLIYSHPFFFNKRVSANESTRTVRAVLKSVRCEPHAYTVSSLSMYASQTKSLQVETTERSCIFYAFATIRRPKESTHALAKYLEKTRPNFCYGFQNRRLAGLGSIKSVKGIVSS